jgi:hypothetical protein
MPDINLLMGTQEPIVIEQDPRVTQTKIVSGAIKTRHLEAGLNAIKFGLEADLPDGVQYKAYFCVDTHKLFMFDGDNWFSSLLS